MQQALVLIQTFKRFLRMKGITYRDLAAATQQSEANVKRIFSSGSLSLKQLESLCAAAGIELLELARMSSSQKQVTRELTAEQELSLSLDRKLFALFYLLLSGASTHQIGSKYRFSAQEIQKYCLQLDRLGLIELLPRNKVRQKVEPHIQWQPDGPLMKAYGQSLCEEFISSKFCGIDERQRFLFGRLSSTSLRAISRRIDRVIADFGEFNDMDRTHPAEQLKPISMLIAYRPWRYSGVERYRK